MLRVTCVCVSVCVFSLIIARETLEACYVIDESFDFIVTSWLLKRFSIWKINTLNLEVRLSCYLICIGIFAYSLILCEDYWNNLFNLSISGNWIFGFIFTFWILTTLLFLLVRKYWFIFLCIGWPSIDKLFVCFLIAGWNQLSLL